MIALLGLLLAAGLIAVMVFSPSPDLPARGVWWSTRALTTLPGVEGGPRTFAWVAFGLNIVLFAPLGVALGIAWPHRGALGATGVGFWVSLGIEVVQGLLLSERNPQFSDVVANAAGCASGYLATAFVVRRATKQQS